MSVVDVERDEKIAQLTRQNYTAPQIAVVVGVTVRSVVRARARLGLTKAVAPRLSAAERVVIQRLIDDGASYYEIARTTGRHVETIKKYWPGRGWTREQITAASVMSRQLARI